MIPPGPSGQDLIERRADTARLGVSLCPSVGSSTMAERMSGEFRRFASADEYGPCTIGLVGLAGRLQHGYRSGRLRHHRGRERDASADFEMHP